ncbi:MAG TPA: hypothetical protein VFN73_02350, partial [Propionibacteriaceae bacterium]|nr:hypothetical protein [Propionibacteriaceae bacterium]
PASVYGLVGLLAGVAYSLLVRAIVAADGPDSDVARAVGRDRKGYLSLFLYLSGLGLAWVSPYIAYALYASVSIMWLIPDRRLGRVAQGGPAAVAGGEPGAAGLSPGQVT